MPITARDIANTVKHDHGLTPSSAAGAVEKCIATLEDINGRTIDRGAIDRLDAGFIEIMIAVEQSKEN